MGSQLHVSLDHHSVLAHINLFIMDDPRNYNLLRYAIDPDDFWKKYQTYSIFFPLVADGNRPNEDTSCILGFPPLYQRNTTFIKGVEVE